MKTSLLLGSLSLSLSLFAAGCSKKPHAPASATAPETYRVQFDLSCGPVTLEVARSQSPNDADRFYNLVKSHYFEGARFFRVVPGFVVQFGLAADPAVSKAWDVPVPDDPVRTANVRGTLAFAKESHPNSATTQLFINLGNNGKLDAMGFSPFGRVTAGMENIDKIYPGDAEKPNQDTITAQGNAYLEKEFPHLDYIKSARIL